jgi:hypothetical protein
MKMGIEAGATWEATEKLLLAVGRGFIPGITSMESMRAFQAPEKRLLIRQLNTAWVPHPFPRILREWVGKRVTPFLPDQ